MTLQFVDWPQEAGHGFMHFWFTHAVSSEHSELTTHSGRHAGGLPVKPGRQEQTLCSFTFRH